MGFTITVAQQVQKCVVTYDQSFPPPSLSFLFVPISFSVSFSTSIWLLNSQLYDGSNWNLYMHCPLFVVRISGRALTRLSTPFQYHHRSHAVICCKKRNASSPRRMEYLLGEAIHMCGLWRESCAFCSMVIIWSRQCRNPVRFSGKIISGTMETICLFCGANTSWDGGINFLVCSSRGVSVIIASCSASLSIALYVVWIAEVSYDIKSICEIWLHVLIMFTILDSWATTAHTLLLFWGWKRKITPLLDPMLFMA